MSVNRLRKANKEPGNLEVVERNRNDRLDIKLRWIVNNRF